MDNIINKDERLKSIAERLLTHYEDTSISELNLLYELKVYRTGLESDLYKLKDNYIHEFKKNINELKPNNIILTKEFEKYINEHVDKIADYEKDIFYINSNIDILQAYHNYHEEMKEYLENIIEHEDK